MSAIGGIVDWGAGVRLERVLDMMRPVAHRGPTATAGTTGDLAVLAGESPWDDPRGGLLVVADARLDNREDLHHRLAEGGGLGADASTAALLAAGFREWGEALPQRLYGDFAFAVWDPGRRRLFAARDPFGCRPLFYSHESGRLVLGSEIKQLLAAGVPAELDDLIVGEYLFRRFEELERTFFAAVRRLPAGHLLSAGPEGATRRRWWLPDTEEIDYADDRDYLHRFVDELEASVRRRLASPRPVAIQLSGGLDSSSLAVVADRIAGGSGSRIELLSARYPGLACDEGPYIRAVQRRVRTPFVEIEPPRRIDPAGLERDFAAIDSPFVDLQRETFESMAGRLQERGAGTLITGLGGDELLHEERYLRDLARDGRFVRLALDCLRGSRYSWNSAPTLFADALKPLVPAAVRRRLSRALGRGWRPPPWATPALVETFLSARVAPAAPRPGFRSATQQSAFEWLSYPQLCWALEALEARASRFGFEVTHPFLDRSLAEYVLAIPLERRLPRGRWKALLRRGLSNLLPPEVRDRRRKTTFVSLERDVWAVGGEELIRAVWDRGSWAAASYVERGSSRPPLPATSWPALQDSWRIATLELWLRHLHALG